MLAWPAERKLVKLAEACCSRPRAEQPFGRGKDGHFGVQVAAQAVSAAQRFKAWSLGVSGRAGGSAAGGLAHVLLAGHAGDGGPGAAGSPRL